MFYIKKFRMIKCILSFTSYYCNMSWCFRFIIYIIFTNDSNQCDSVISYIKGKNTLNYITIKKYLMSWKLCHNGKILKANFHMPKYIRNSHSWMMKTLFCHQILMGFFSSFLRFTILLLLLYEPTHFWPLFAMQIDQSSSCGLLFDNNQVTEAS